MRSYKEVQVMEMYLQVFSASEKHVRQKRLQALAAVAHGLSQSMVRRHTGSNRLAKDNEV